MELSFRCSMLAQEAYAMQGGLMGNGPLELHSEGKYFEIEVTRTTRGRQDARHV